MRELFWVILNLLIPTIAAWFWSLPFLRHLQSRLMMLTVAVATGQFALTTITLQTATLVRPATDTPLGAGTAMTLMLMLIAIRYCPFRRAEETSGCSASSSLKNDSLSILFALVIGWAFFSPHLMQIDGDIIVSNVYWDLPYQLSLIQSFSIGGNFPPSNEMMSNTPLLYHYMYFLLVAIYSSGLGLVVGINLTSILTFTLILTGLVGAAEELFQEKRAGAAIWALTLTSSSFAFLDMLFFPQMSVNEFIRQAGENASYLGLSQDIIPTYNGNMFNLFYFLEERQLGVASLMIIFFVVLLSRRERLSLRALATYGLVFGSCFSWHFFATVAVCIATTMLACCDRLRLKTIAFLLPLVICLAAQVLWLDLEQARDFFKPEMFAVPRINYMFAGDPNVKDSQLIPIMLYWGFALGIKILLLPMGLIIIRRTFPETSAPLTYMVVTLFLLSNLVLLSPISIYENHKWVRPMLLLIDLASMIAIFSLWRQNTLPARMLSLAFFMLCLPSGIAENMGYFLPQKSSVFVSESSNLVTYLQNSTPVGSVIISESPRDIVFAGRKLFLSDPSTLGGSFRLDLFYALTERRMKLVSTLYAATSLQTFCNIAKRHGIHFIDPSFKSQQLMILSSAPTECLSESLRTSNNLSVQLLNVACLCDRQSITS